MSDPKEYVPFRDHILEHGVGVERKIITYVSKVPDCGDPGCKWPAFWHGLTDEQLNGAAIVLTRLTHEMGDDMKVNAQRFSQFVTHLFAEQQRRDGKVLEWSCLSEGAES